jgi:predicted S18 family serine protease
MVKNYMLTLAILSLMLVASYASAQAVGSAQQQIIGSSSIRAPAVILTNNTGSLTNFSLIITNGDGNVSIKGPAIVGNSTTQSAYTAAMYASNYTGHNFSNYNFTYTILDAGDNVSGPSAGGAMTVLAVSAFENKPLRTDFTMTGTISPNGSIGEIGGVYDKAGAAKNNGMELILVPKVAPTDPEDELYLLVQTNYDIPLVQVANVSQALHFAFNDSLSGLANQTSYNFYTDYHANSLPNATINCSVQCNSATFNLLLNATFDLTRSDINKLNANPKFANISAQLGKVLNQSINISKHGYLYTGADFAFLDYVNTFYFNGYSTNRSSALDLLDNVQNFCSTLTPPPLTKSNYDYVINAELRQVWGNYTINSVVKSYNSSQIDSDEILDELYLGAQSNGWCTAANLVYNVTNQSGTYVATSSALREVALQRINSALPYGQSLYLATAQQEYKDTNYPVAILDADYAFALANATTKSGLPTAELNNMSFALASNSTYSVWASEFAKEAQFYINESQLTSNATIAKSYAESGYSAALLAHQISNDTSIINQNLIVVAQPVPTVPVVAPQTNSSTQLQNLTNYITYTQELLFALILLVVTLLIINIILIIIVISKLSPPKQRTTNRKQKK